jgi:hypothetical protein
MGLPFRPDDLQPDDLPNLARSVYTAARDELPRRQALRLMWRVIDRLDADRVVVPKPSTIRHCAERARARTLLARGKSESDVQAETGLRRKVILQVADELDQLTAPDDETA